MSDFDDNGRWLLVSDVDDTLTGDDAALVELVRAWEGAPGLTVAYNSSRPCASLRRTLRQTPHLPPPDYLIGALGTEIEDGRSRQPLDSYIVHLGADWQREQIVALIAPLGYTPHPDEFQTPFKASYDVPGSEARQMVRRRLDEAGLAATLIYSPANYLDVIPRSAGKGTAVEFLRRRLDLPGERVVVAGDSANDVAMFRAPFRGIVVGNADEALRALSGEHIYHAAANHAAGVLEGLRRWGVV